MSEKSRLFKVQATRLLILGCVLWLGCTPGGSATSRVTGTVTCDGEPIAEGSIVFLSVDGSTPPVGGKIENGAFSLKVPAGPKKVEITAMREEVAPETIPGIVEAGDKVATNYLPPRYNAQTELTADVKAGESNEFTFSLTLE